METSAVLASAEDRVVDEAVAALEPRQHGYDQASSAAECRSYVRHLFGLVVQCVHEGHAEPVIAASRQVAADRFGAGLDIAETGRAFNVLEEVLWHEVAGALAGEQRIEALGLVHAILGAGKDALVQTSWRCAGGEERRGRPAACAAPRGRRGGPPQPGRTASQASAVRTQVEWGRRAGSSWMTSAGATPCSTRVASRIVAALEGLRARWEYTPPCSAPGPGSSSESPVVDVGEPPKGQHQPLAYDQVPARTGWSAPSTPSPAPFMAIVGEPGVGRGTGPGPLAYDPRRRRRLTTFAITAANLGLPLQNTTELLRFVGRLTPAMSSRGWTSPPRPSTPSKHKKWLARSTTWSRIGRAPAVPARARHDDSSQPAPWPSRSSRNSFMYLTDYQPMRRAGVPRSASRA